MLLTRYSNECHFDKFVIYRIPVVALISVISVTLIMGSSVNDEYGVFNHCCVLMMVYSILSCRFWPHNSACKLKKITVRIIRLFAYSKGGTL